MSEWVWETLHADHRLALRAAKTHYDSATAHQRLRVFENPTFGRVLTLDGVVQTTEADNFIYHEMLAHVPILAHGAAERVLIVGGGDGGTAREVLRHAGLRHVTLVEIDREVVELARTHLPNLAGGAFDDDRLELVISDGLAYLRGTDRRFDVILVDSTDPVGPGEALFSAAFYAAARACLRDGGILATQNGIPFLQGEVLARTMRAFASLFADYSAYLATVPSYAGGPMAFGWGSDSAAGRADLETLQRRFAMSGLSTRYYTPEVHCAAFALPPCIRELFP